MRSWTALLFLIPTIGQADCIYDSQKGHYDCRGNEANRSVTATPGQITPGQYDARSSSMTRRGNGYGARRRGGCVEVRHSGSVSHYDCTTKALSAVPEQIERQPYVPYWERRAELEGQSLEEFMESLR